MDNTPLELEYARRCKTPSNINEHLPTLRQYASRVRRVTEFGVDTTANSTVAMMASLPGRMVSYDREDLDVGYLEALADSAGVDWVFCRANVLDVEIEPTDLLLIDSWHHYVQLKAELELHADSVATYIAMHDTEVYRDVGSENYSGGLWQAIEEAVASGQWAICHLSTANNGLTILERKSPPVSRVPDMAVIEEARRLVKLAFGE
jgi:hypothetical protein